ncbi:J domain-containing protein [Clavibacter capsici]|uniref:J domain-containing protein n=1 Tax=Clavibacter capsici TaxID=1874630 RepID=UPI00287B9C95|nr:J domain-containing protein [Clavibacter capsici]
MDPVLAAALLGVDVDADRTAVNRAYARHARDTHPDRLPGATPQQLRVAHERFVQLTLARDALHLRQRVGAERVGGDTREGRPAPRRRRPRDPQPRPSAATPTADPDVSSPAAAWARPSPRCARSRGS